MGSAKSNLKKLVEEKNTPKNLSDPYVKDLFLQVFTGMQGRYSRLKIVLALENGPMNTFQLSKKLGYDYKSIQRNLRVLEEHNLVERIGKGYGKMFFLSDRLSQNLPMLLEVIEKVDKKINTKKKYIS